MSSGTWCNRRCLKTTPHRPHAERFNQSYDAWSLQLSFQIFTFAHWFVAVPSLPPSTHSLFWISSLRILSLCFSSPLLLITIPSSLSVTVILGPFWLKSTHQSFYSSYVLCKCKLKNKVCAAAFLLGYPKYTGQLVFARGYERYYPSFWMSSVIGITGTKVQKLTLRVRALQVGLSDEVSRWIATVGNVFQHHNIPCAPLYLSSQEC